MEAAQNDAEKLGGIVPFCSIDVRKYYSFIFPGVTMKRSESARQLVADKIAIRNKLIARLAPRTRLVVAHARSVSIKLWEWNCVKAKTARAECFAVMIVRLSLKMGSICGQLRKPLKVQASPLSITRSGSGVVLIG